MASRTGAAKVILLCVGLVQATQAPVPDCSFSGRVFSGNNDWEDLGTSCGKTFGAAFSLEFNVRVDEERNEACLFDFGEPGYSNNMQMYKHATDVNRWCFYIHPAGSDVTCDIIMAVGQPHHILINSNANGDVKVFHNGILRGSARSLAASVSRELWVARAQWSGAPYFKGQVTDMRIWYSDIIEPTWVNPVCSFSGRVFSGNSNDWQDLGTNCAKIFGAPFSIAFSVRNDEDRHEARLFDFGNPSYANNIFFYKHADANKWCLQSTGYSVTCDIIMAVGETHQILINSNANGDFKVFQNSQLVASATAPAGDLSRELWVARGQWSGAPYFKGQITDMRIWYNDIIEPTVLPPVCSFSGHVFSGNHDWVDLGANCAMSFGQPFSMAFNVRNDEDRDEARVFDFGNSSYSSNLFLYKHPDHNKKWCFAIADVEQCNIDLPVGQLEHILITSDANGNTKVYQSGNLVGSFTKVAPEQSRVLWVARGQWVGAPFFKGQVDFRIWNEIIDPAALKVQPDCAYGGRYFSGADGDYEDLSSSCQNTFGGAVSVAFTASWEESRHWSRIFDYGIEGAQNGFLVAMNLADKFQLHHWSPVATNSIVGWAQGLNEKRRYLVTIGTSGKVTVWRDGSLDFEETFTPLPVATRKLWVAKSLWSASDPYFKGTVEDLWVWHSEVTWDSVVTTTTTTSTSSTTMTTTSSMGSPSPGLSPPSLSPPSPSPAVVAPSTVPSPSQGTLQALLPSPSLPPSLSSPGVAPGLVPSAETPPDALPSPSSPTPSSMPAHVEPISSPSSLDAAPSPRLSSPPAPSPLASPDSSPNSSLTTMMTEATVMMTPATTVAAVSSSVKSRSTLSPSSTGSNSGIGGGSETLQEVGSTGPATSTRTGTTTTSTFYYEANPVTVGVAVGGLDVADMKANEAVQQSLLRAVQSGVLAGMAMPLAGARPRHGRPELKAARRLRGRALQAAVVEISMDFSPPGEMSAAEMGTSLTESIDVLKNAVESALRAAPELVTLAGQVLSAEITISFKAEEATVPEGHVPNFLANIEDLTAIALESLAADDTNNVTMPVPGLGTLFATKVENMSSSVKTTGPVSIELPKAFLSSIVKSSLASPIPGEELVFSAISVDGDTAKKLGALAAMVLDLSWLKGKDDFSVNGLAEPVEMELPVASNISGVTCAYWDEAAGAWSSNGVRVGRSTDGLLVCETTHFSLFGAILEGMLKTFLCANFNMFTTENLREVIEGDWQWSLGAVFYYFVVGGLSLFFLEAAMLDYYRYQKYHWTDEFFLVATEMKPPDVKTPPPQDGPLTKFKLMICGVVAVVCACCASDALKEAMDDICSNWFEHFSVVRDVLETACSSIAFALHAPSCALAAILRAINHTSDKTARKLLLANARRRAAAKLGMSEDLVLFVLEDEDLATYITETLAERQASTRVSVKKRELSGIRRISLGKPKAGAEKSKAQNNAHWSEEKAACWRGNTDQFTAWSHLRQEVNEAMLAQTKHTHTKCEMLLGMIHDLLHHNPIAMIFAIDIHNTCKQKVTILAAELMGAFTLCAVFFQGGGMVKPKAMGDMCDSDEEEESVGMRIGRFLGIAIASLVIAGLPVGLLESLMTKGFKKVEGSRGSAAWKKQLRAWRIQEAMFWLCAAAYLGFCAAYLLVFIANTDPEGHWEYTFSGALSLFQDLMAFPLFIALSIPICSKAWLYVHAKATNVTPEFLVRRAIVNLHRDTNMMLPVEQV